MPRKPVSGRRNRRAGTLVPRIKPPPDPYELPRTFGVVAMLYNERVADPAEMITAEAARQIELRAIRKIKGALSFLLD
jgi:hypothetical protein